MVESEEPTAVASTSIVLVRSGGQRVRPSDQTTKSTSLPTLRVPPSKSGLPGKERVIKGDGMALEEQWNGKQR